MPHESDKETEHTQNVNAEPVVRPREAEITTNVPDGLYDKGLHAIQRADLPVLVEICRVVSSFAIF